MDNSDNVETDNFLVNNKAGKKSVTTGQWVIFSVQLVMFFAIIGITIFFSFNTYSILDRCENFVPPENCNQPIGEFAIEPNTVSTNIISGCGTSQKDICNFTNVTSITEAIKICNENINICNRFNYSEKTQKMSIVSLQGDVSASNTGHLFLRQNGVTYVGSNPDIVKTVNPVFESVSFTKPSAYIGGAVTTSSSTGNNGTTVQVSGGGGGGGY